MAIKSNVPRVIGQEGQKHFNNSVKENLDILTGKASNSKYDRALIVRDLEKAGFDLDEFLACDKRHPYPLPYNSTLCDCVADARAIYDSGWTFVAGTDQSDAINAAISENAGGKVILPPGDIYIANPIKLVSNTYLQSNYYGTRLICNQGAQNAIEVDSSLFEVSQFTLDGLYLLDARNYLGTAETSGYGVFANRAVNGVNIINCNIKGFSDGSIFVGADTNTRAGDCIYIDNTWVFPGSVSHVAIGIGNYNNFCTLTNIKCDGDGSVVKRLNGNALAGNLIINSLKHEAGDSTYKSIDMDELDRVTVSNVSRRTDDGVETAISNISRYGSYLNLQNTKTDGSASSPYTLEFETGEKMQARNFIGDLYFAEDTYVRRALASSSDLPYARFYGNYLFGTPPVDQDSFGAMDMAPLVVYNPSNETLNNAGALFSARNNDTPTVPAIKIVNENGGTIITFDWDLPKITFGGISGQSITPDIIAVSGTPEGVVTAGVGSIALRVDGGAGTCLYVKESGAGNTGWVAK